MTVPPRRLASASLRPMLLAVAVAGVGAMPVFLLGGLAVLIRAELGFSEARLGVIVAAFFAAASLGAVPAGVVSDRIGSHRAVVAGLAGSGGALLGAALSRSWWHLTLAMLLGGGAHALLQVAANLMLAGRVASENQGLAFGVKQSATPAAILLAGASLPVLAITFGWRSVYLAACAAAVVCLLTRLRRRGGPRPTTSSHVTDGTISSPRVALVVLAISAGLGAGAANGLGAFLVEFAVQSGISLADAGVLLSVSSATSVLSRILAGWLADRHGGADLGVMAAMLLVGAGAFATMPLVSGNLTGLLVVGVLAFAAGWGWPGLINFIVARRNPRAPAAATGIVHAGIYVGGVIGPMAMGFAVSTFSYTVAWVSAGLSIAVGALLTLVARHAIRSGTVQTTVSRS